MLWVRADGLPVGAVLAPANAAENKLVAKLLESAPDAELPAWLLADKGFDDDGLARRLAKLGVRLLAPHRRNRTKPTRHDGRTAKRLKKRYVVERAFAWLQGFRRLTCRYERWSFIHAGLIALACLIIIARTL
jgi:IS5 family transposase